jgi:hypothetical protein
MSPERRLKLTRHSLLTALSMDTLAFAFTPRSQKDILAWFGSSKTMYPLHSKNKKLNNRGSYTADFILALMNTLSEVNPIEFDDLYELSDEVSIAVASIPTKWNVDYFIDAYDVHMSKQESTVLPIAAGMVAAYYCGLTDSSFQFLLDLFASFQSVFNFSDRDFDAGIATAILVYRLYHTGWFCCESMEELISLSVVNGILKERIELLIENSLNGEFLSNRVTTDLIGEELNYAESVLWQSLFYMTRVSTAYPREITKSLPRDQLPEIMIGRLTLPADVASLFGCLCTVSEPNYHPLVNKHLREGTVYVSEVDELLSYLT